MKRAAGGLFGFFVLLAAAVIAVLTIFKPILVDRSSELQPPPLNIAWNGSDSVIVGGKPGKTDDLPEILDGQTPYFDAYGAETRALRVAIDPGAKARDFEKLLLYIRFSRFYKIWLFDSSKKTAVYMQYGREGVMRPINLPPNSLINWGLRENLAEEGKEVDQLVPIFLPYTLAAGDEVEVFALAVFSPDGVELRGEGKSRKYAAIEELFDDLPRFLPPDRRVAVVIDIVSHNLEMGKLFEVAAAARKFGVKYLMYGFKIRNVKLPAIHK